MCRQPCPLEREHRLAGRRTGGQHVVDQHYLGIGRYSPVGGATGNRGHPPSQVASPLCGCQAHRITHSAPHSQQGQHPAVRQPSHSYRGRTQHRIAASAPRRHPSARRGHQDQRKTWRAQLGERSREPHSEWFRQIPPSSLLDGEHRAARWTRVRPERPARDARVGARPHPHRRTGQSECAFGAPTGSRTSATRTGGGQHQIEQGSHQPSVRPPADKFARPLRRSRQNAGFVAAELFAPLRRCGRGLPLLTGKW